MGLYGPRIPVGSPPFAPARFGLLSVATPAEDAPQGARHGTVTTPESCDELGLYVDVCDFNEPRPVKDTSGRTQLRAADPFVVFAHDTCSPVGRTYDEARDRAGIMLANGEARAVEREFWTGTAGTKPHLAADTEDELPNGQLLQPAATLVEASAVSPLLALRAIESALGECYGGQGVLHMPRGDAAVLRALGGVVREGQRLETGVGTLVAAGAGYPGTAPDGTETVGQSTWYATGSVVYRRTDVEFATKGDAEALARSVNTRTVIAERGYSLTWDCCLLAVHVDWTGEVAA